uniref:Protein kinase domain-containing protein n=1 Tax=Trichobilharzia regenti TaxID=157069 RepID=A0AA85JBP0_TRIRE
MPKLNQENITQSDCIPNSVVVEPKDHMIGGCPPAAFCSTPGPMNNFSSSSLKVDGAVAPKTVSGDVLLNALQVTPIHPVFANQNKSSACEMEKTLSQLDYHHLKDTPLQHNNNGDHNNATHYSLSLLSRELVVQLTAIDFSNPPQLSQCSPSDEHRQNCQQQDCQFQSPGLSRPIGSGKKSSTYTKRLTRHFRRENMILNRSYMELFVAGDAKGALLKIRGQTDYKSFTQLLFPNRRKNLKKIGEGCFGEVFRCWAGKRVVLKFIPIEGNVKFNGESQKTFNEVLSEVIVSKELTALAMGYASCTSGFVELI